MILRFELLIALAILVAVALIDAGSAWAAGCWFGAGMCFEEFLSVARTTARAHRRLDNAARVRAMSAGCPLGATTHYEMSKRREGCPGCNDEAQKAKKEALLVCDCGTIDGRPHEPDCVWWNKQDLRTAREREKRMHGRE